MNTKIKKVILIFNQLSLRERALFLLVSLVAVYTLWDTLFIQPLQMYTKELHEKINVEHKQISVLHKTLHSLKAAHVNNPNTAQLKKLSELLDMLATQDAKLGRLTHHLVPPTEIPQVLHRVLKRNEGIQINKLENIVPKKILLASETSTLFSSTYKHGLHVHLSGHYLDIMTYMRQLEKAEWAFFWTTLQLNTDNYPITHVRLTLFTLGFEPYWVEI